MDRGVRHPRRNGRLTRSDHAGRRGSRSIGNHAAALAASGAKSITGLSALPRSTRSFREAKAQFNGKAWLDYWTGDPWTRGSYAAYNPRQVTKYWGYAGGPEGRVHFAGEHVGAGDRWQTSTGVQYPGEQAGGSSVRRLILCRRCKVACEGISARLMSGCHEVLSVAELPVHGSYMFMG